MKIAIIGQDFEAKKKIINKFMELCPTYGTLKETIYDDEIEIPDDVQFKEEWNGTERELYAKMSFLVSQMDKYADKENVIYVGHSLDVLVEVLECNSNGYVSEDFVEKMIYWNQKLMKKLDLIYWLPDSDKILSEETLKHLNEIGEKETLTEDEENELLTIINHQWEVVYNNIWNDYLHNFDKSVILPRYCPGIGVFESATPAAELADIVNDLEETKGKDTRLDDIAALDRIIKDKRLLEGMKSILKQNTIPLPSGERITSGGISLDKPV